MFFYGLIFVFFIMQTNFEIHDLIYIQFGGKEIDLHNDFSFAADQFLVTDKEIKLLFEKFSSRKDHNANYAIQFTAKNYSYLFTIDPDPTYIINDSHLDGITFFPSVDRDINDGLIDQKRPTAKDDLIFMFMSGRTIRFCAEEVFVEEIESTEQ